jgi:hypothetical protein
MKTPQIVAHVLVPADQHAPEAIHPTMRPLHDPPPRPEPGVLLQRFGLFPPRSDVCGEPKFGEQAADLVIIIACVQAHPLGRGRGRCRPLDGDTLKSLPHPLEVMPMSPLHRKANGHAAARGEDAALGPDFPAIGRLLADLFPPQGGLWSWRHPSRAMPSPSLSRPHRPPGDSSTALGRRQPPSTLGRGDGRNYGSRCPSPATHSTGSQGGARRKWPPSPAEPRHGADGPPGGVVCAAGAAARYAPTIRQAYANHGGFSRGLHASVRLL